MSAATCQAQAGTGASVSWANAEGGLKFNLADSITDTTTPIAVPTSTGTNFSWLKHLVLAVTGAGTTNISNRNIYMGSSAATGLALFFDAITVASYVQAASGNRPASDGSNGATPSAGTYPGGSFTAMTTSPQVYDSSSVASSSTGPNGKMCVVCMSVDNTFVGGAGSATALPDIKIRYDEA
jgi:hypothetical protein